MVEDLFRSLVLLMRCLPGLLVGSGIVFGFLCATASETTAQLSLDLAEAVSSADDPTRVPDLAGLPLVVSDGFRVWRDEMPDGCNSLPTILGIRILVLMRGRPCHRERVWKCSTVWIRPPWGSWAGSAV